MGCLQILIQYIISDNKKNKGICVVICKSDTIERTLLQYNN